MDVSDPLNPFIPFPPSHPGLRLTMPLYTDGKHNMVIHNDPRVYMFLTGPPYPYTAQSWDEYWPILSSSSTTAAEELASIISSHSQEQGGGEGKGKRKWVGKEGLPCTAIRDMGDLDEDGVGRFLGSIGIRLAAFDEIEDPILRAELVSRNESYSPGDPKIAYEIGFFLSPEAHGRGIMPVALRLLIDGFTVPYMNAHLIKGIYFVENRASKRVFEKCGFEHVADYGDVVEVAESKTGGVKGPRMGIGLMVWSREGVGMEEDG